MCVLFQDFLRKYPERFEEIIPSLTRVLRSIEEPEGKIACIWMIGEYGETIAEAPYILEGLIESFPEEQDSLVKMELLTATTKLFFKRPPELKDMLARLLKMAINTSGAAVAGASGAGGKIVHIDVRDRALLYYRLLQFDVHEAARVVNSAKKAAAASSSAAGASATVDGGRSLLFAEQVDLDLYAKIFAEFNSLSVVYHTPQERFVKAPVYDEEEEKKREAEELAKAEAETASAALTGGAAKDASAAAEEAEDILPSGALGGVSSSSPAASTAAPTTPARAGGEVDLLGDFMNSLEVSSPLSAAAPAAPTLQFLAGQTLDKATYQSKWGSLSAAGPPVELAIKSRPITSALIEQLLSSSANIITFASGTVGNMIKFFLFGRDVSGAAATAAAAQWPRESSRTRRAAAASAQIDASGSQADRACLCCLLCVSSSPPLCI